MFIITKDLINNGEYNNHVFVSTMNKGDKKQALIERLTPKCIHKFRLLDDDGVIYLYGLSNSNDDERAFIPLDYYMYDLGCTEIQYFNNGVWETL